ncbi:MAG: hypothetical protein EOP10_04920 [Proteobacteria bacterium]|nr:MAG: hypothetical protein EOP10_04920 [Pseudomonadota bacterium]
MFIFWVAAILVILGVTMILRALHLKSLPPKAHSYRKQYQQLVARIDMCVTRLNTLGNLVPHVKDPKVLDQFEACLRMSEALLSALVKVPPFGFKPEMIGFIQPLVMKTEEKIEAAYTRFKLVIEGKPLFGQLIDRWQKDTDIPAKGCYFCSRPFMKAYFKPASLKVDGIQLRVFGCQICVAELRANKKVKVLYFIEYGQPVHWALVEAYRPIEQYWNLNRRRSSRVTKDFELVSEN